MSAIKRRMWLSILRRSEITSADRTPRRPRSSMSVRISIALSGERRSCAMIE